MGDTMQLFFDGPIDVGMVMSVDVAPQTANTIEKTTALVVNKPVSFSSFNEPRFVLGHLSEGMPNMRTIPRTNVRERKRLCHAVEWSASQTEVR